VNAVHFGDFATFSSLGAQEGGTPVIDLYLNADLTNPASLPMPQSQLMFTNIHNDAAALKSIEDWLTEMSNPLVPQCRVSFEIDGADFTNFGDNIWITGDAPQLGAWNPTHGLELDGTAFPAWRGSIILPQGLAIQFKAVDVLQNGVIGWEAGGNRTFTVPAQPSAAFVGTWQR
jgi:Starch binding domain